VAGRPLVCFNIPGMSSIIRAVRQVASGLGRLAEDRFCLIRELQLADTNGFAFVPSVELTETDVIDMLVEAGYGVCDALRLVMDARLYFVKHLPRRFKVVDRWPARP
jgi:hypothetical protein